MASDGTGGLVYVKAVEGVPHVFACRYLTGSWSAPIRVDWDQPFAASQPQIAAGPGGELLIVWVTQVATVHGSVQVRPLFGPAGRWQLEFRPLAARRPERRGRDRGRPLAFVHLARQGDRRHRAITFTFNQNTFSTAVQLRPGDVMADIRVARLNGDRWSRLGAINRNPEASMRPPSATNGPQVGTGAEGAAVVAWQEPDQTGTARIWVRRIFGTTPGPILQASPTSWEGKPVTADADALSLRHSLRGGSDRDARRPGQWLRSGWPPAGQFVAIRLLEHRRRRRADPARRWGWRGATGGGRRPPRRSRYRKSRTQRLDATRLPRRIAAAADRQQRAKEGWWGRDACRPAGSGGGRTGGRRRPRRRRPRRLPGARCRRCRRSR